MKLENEKPDQGSPDRPDRWLENEEIKLLRETVQRQRKIIAEQKETIASITLENERRTQIIISSFKNTHQFVNLLARFDDLLTKRSEGKLENVASKRKNPMESVLDECQRRSTEKSIEVEEIAPMAVEVLVSENSESKSKGIQKPLTKPLETILIEKSIRQKVTKEQSSMANKSKRQERKQLSESKLTEPPELVSEKADQSNILEISEQERPKLNGPKTRKRSKSIESMQEKSKHEKPKTKSPVKAKSKSKKSKLKIKDVTIIDDRILQVEAAAFERENMKIETESEDEFIQISLPPKKKRKVNRRFGIKN